MWGIVAKGIEGCFLIPFGRGREAMMMMMRKKEEKEEEKKIGGGGCDKEGGRDEAWDNCLVFFGMND